MVSDAGSFRFAFLDHEKKLYVSSQFEWPTHRSTILAYIDTILLDAIQSSPHTTPTKVRNTSLLSYPRYLRGQWRFGEESDDELDKEDDEEDFVDIVRDGDRIALRTVIKKAD